MLACFNAGIRVVDIRNPYAPLEVGYFIPEINANTTPSCIEIAGVEECDTAIQTNNVDLDDRGYIYAVDRASTGLVVLELTGAAREIAGLGEAPWTWRAPDDRQDPVPTPPLPGENVPRPASSGGWLKTRLRSGPLARPQRAGRFRVPGTLRAPYRTYFVNPPPANGREIGPSAA